MKLYSISIIYFMNGVGMIKITNIFMSCIIEIPFLGFGRLAGLVLLSPLSRFLGVP